MSRNNAILNSLFICLLAFSLGFSGCKGVDREPRPADQQPPAPAPAPAPTPVPKDPGRGGVTSPFSSICFSCHQNFFLNSSKFYDFRKKMSGFGGDLYGESFHGDQFNEYEQCAPCHGIFQLSHTKPGAESHYPAAAKHGGSIAPKTHEATIDSVTVYDGVVIVTFTIENYESDRVHAEFTIAKRTEDFQMEGADELVAGSWINLLPKSRESSTNTKITIVGGSRLEEGENAVTGGIPTGSGGTTFTYTFPYDFKGSPLWESPADHEAANYCEDNDSVCVKYVETIIGRINADGAWDPHGTYRLGITGRDPGDGLYARFTAVTDFKLISGAVDEFAPPAPYVQIGQESCTSCHGARLVFPRNNVHDQQYTEVGVCITCHNPYTYDRKASQRKRDGWVNISLNRMVHMLHSGVKGYTIDGKEYEKVVFPDWIAPGTANCTACHVGEIPPEGKGWNRKDEEVMETCNTCHGPGGYLVRSHPSSEPWPYCWQCHNDKDPWSEMDGFISHPNVYHRVGNRLQALKTQRENYHFKLVGVEDAVFEATPVVSWQVLDAAGNPYHLVNDISIDGGPQLQIGWGFGDDWTNEGSGEKGGNNDDGGRPVGLTVVASGEHANTVISGDGHTAISTFPPLTNERAGKGTPYANLAAAWEGRRGFVAIQRWITDNGVRRRLTSLVRPITLGSGSVDLDAAAPRRNTVNASATPIPEEWGCQSCHSDDRASSCLDCHGTITRHADYTADNNIQGCITCHNAGSHRSISGMENGEPPYSIDLMYLMHKIHSAPSILYPGSVAGNCHACHAKRGDVTGSSGQNNCLSCHAAKPDPGRLGIIADWPGAIDDYGLRGPE